MHPATCGPSPPSFFNHGGEARCGAQPKGCHSGPRQMPSSVLNFGTTETRKSTRKLEETGRPQLGQPVPGRRSGCSRRSER
eukprot:3474975-Lingulodinium_polyedra.AAC.1